ncbi:MAG: type II toxin-antitoxin system RelE/ParE family toxin [Myxococcota bacterium]
MKRYRVRWSSVARTDLLEILDFIAEHSSSDAVRVLNRLEARARTLARFPERGRVVPELRRQGITAFRELLEGPWRLVYRIDGREVGGLAVLDARREIEDLLLQRLLGLQ